MSPDLTAAREELIRLCRNRKTRRVIFTRSAPCDWRPRSVVHPKFGGYFSDVGAWEYLAELLEGGHAIEEVTLSNPPGGRAYVMNVDLGPHQPQLYVKIQIKADCVFGRSFHYSYHQQIQ
jgi:hypothetical protein